MNNDFQVMFHNIDQTTALIDAVDKKGFKN